MIIKEQDNKQVYSDGNIVEREMLDIAQQYPEDLSEEFISQSSKYTINNTFSSVRKNILNWYPFEKDATVLEVGAGMGSITGLLCDKVKHVTALEMSKARAEVIRARYPKRENLTIMSEDINEWNTKETFDYVIFVGVLEYAGVFLNTQNPFKSFMENIKRYLKEDGTLLFAIENRFGLKYWLGGSEDHLQEPYIGIKGYDNTNTPRTFSKAELEELLNSVGLKHYRFYNVLPDYKFPEIICTDEYQPSYLNLKKLSFTYSRNSSLVLNEKNIYKDIIQNRVLDFFANSYLIEARIEHLKEPHIIYISSKGEVQKQYRVSTTIDSEGNIKKIPMHINAVEHINNIYENEQNIKKRGVQLIDSVRKGDSLYSKFYNGTSAQDYFEDLLINNDINGVRELIHSLRKNLLLSSDIAKPYENIMKNICDDQDDLLLNSGVILENGYIDMTFYNAFWEDKNLIFYDQEWCFKNVPLDFIIYYAIKSSYSRMDIKTQISLEQILKLENLYDKQDIFDKLESYIWSNVLYRQTDFYGEDGYCNRYGNGNLLVDKFNEIQEELKAKDIKNIELSDELSKRQEKIEEVEKQIIDLTEKIQKTQNDLENKKEEIESYKLDLQDKEKKINEYDIKQRRMIEQYEIEISNKEGHIQQLLETERRMNHDVQQLEGSYLYRGLKKIWYINSLMFPLNSKRRFFGSVLLKYRKHPIQLLKKCSISRLRNMMMYLEKESIGDVLDRVEQCVIVDEDTPSIEINNVREINNIEECEEIIFTEEKSPSVSIIIPVYNQFSFTYHCLESIKKNTKNVAYEIIIADDCSTDLTLHIEKKVKNIKVIRNAQNLRFLKNCNNAAQYAKGKYILFLNNDTQVQENWLEPLVELIQKDSTIGLVGSKLIYSNGKLQEAGGILWKDATAWNYGNGQNSDLPEFNYVKEVDYISGASIMIAKSIWKKLGGFDESFAPAYCEDSDLAFRVRELGYKVVYQPLSKVVHFEGISNGTDTSQGQKAYQIINQERFYKKWKNILEKEHFSNGENVFLARDRSSSKPILLMIDHYVPQFDKDAGSRTIYQYIDMFVKMGYQVKFIGDNFYQHEPYTTILQQMGVEVLYGTYYANNWKKWIVENANYIQYVFLNRPHISVKYIDFIRNNTQARIIYYGHDLHFLREERKYILTQDSKALSDSNEWKRKELSLIEKADVAYYPSNVEVNEIKKIAPSVNVKSIIPYIFERKNTILYEPQFRKDIMFVGGFNHTPNVDAVKWFYTEIFPRIKEKEPTIKCYVVGSNPPKEIREFEREDFIVTGYVSDEELEDFYRQIRMVIVPLRYGAGIKGKVVEAMSYSVPVVTTSIGAEGIIDQRNCLQISDDASDFSEKVVSMYNDMEQLKTISKLEERCIEDVYSVDSAWNIIKKDFE